MIDVAVKPPAYSEHIDTFSLPLHPGKFRRRLEEDPSPVSPVPENYVFNPATPPVSSIDPQVISGPDFITRKELGTDKLDDDLIALEARSAQLEQQIQLIRQPFIGGSQRGRTNVKPALINIQAVCPGARQHETHSPT